MNTIYRHDAEYPIRLTKLEKPPPEITISAPLEPGIVVAIVGTRKPCKEAAAFARLLAAKVVEAGGIIASGAALGIDTAAHLGALDAGGRTWAVAPSGSDHEVPSSNAPLYSRIRSSAGSAVIWPFPADVCGRHWPFLQRNGVLAALSDALVIVQAGFKSGARNAASWARMVKCPVWVVAPAPWEPTGNLGVPEEERPDFRGCILELEGGACLLTRPARLLDALGLNRPHQKTNATLPLFTRPLSEAEARVVKGLSGSPQHADEVALRVGLDAPTVATALLTLALEDVVVEGPGGFFRRA